MPNNTPWTSAKSWSAVVAAVVLVIASFALGMIYRPSAWYRSLNKSRITPPNWTFGVVWTVLYSLLGVSMVAACYGTSHPESWVLPVLNIMVSLMFSPVMFGLGSLAGGAWITFACSVLGLFTLLQFATYNDSALGAGLMVPYMVWLFIANYLAWFAWETNTRCRVTVGGYSSRRGSLYPRC